MKKMITFILGAAMAISLVGCSGNNGSSNHGGSGDGSTSSYSSAVEVLVFRGSKVPHRRRRFGAHDHRCPRRL